MIVVVDVVGGIPVEEYVTDVGESVDGELVVVSFCNDSVNCLVVVSVINDAVCFADSVNGMIVVSSLGIVVVVVIVEYVFDVLTELSVVLLLTADTGAVVSAVAFPSAVESFVRQVVCVVAPARSVVLKYVPVSSSIGTAMREGTYNN